MKKLQALTFLSLVLLLYFCLIFSSALATELHGYTQAQHYEYLLLGTYPTEADGTRAPVLWRVLEVNDGKALILSDKILDVQQVIFCDNKKDSDARKFRKISSFIESDLYTWLNNDMLNDLCSEQEFSYAVLDTELGKLYPLTEEQLLTPAYGFTSTRWMGDEEGCLPSRQFYATDYAKTHELYANYTIPANNKLTVDKRYKSSSAWGANVKDPKDIKMTLIGVNGHLSYAVYTRVNIGVLPAMLLDTSLLSVTGGSGTATDPYTLSPKEE